MNTQERIKKLEQDRERLLQALSEAIGLLDCGSGLWEYSDPTLDIKRLQETLEEMMRAYK